jgi:hypothetical protein
VFQLRFIASVLTAILFSASAFAGTWAVGTCKPKLAFFTTIQQAVTSVPPGSTIEVCPGTYPETVTITQPLTLQGVLVGGSMAIIAPPAGGLIHAVYDASFGGGEPIYYQILVQLPFSSGAVNISNLAVEGAGATATATASWFAGIIYQDASGTVKGVAARTPEWGEWGEFGGEGIGILATTQTPAAQTVTVQNSSVISPNGIAAFTGSGAGALTANISTNTITYNRSLAIRTNGIQVSGPTMATVQSNIISGVFTGLHLNGSAVSLTGNTIYRVSNGIVILGGSNAITGNRIANITVGILNLATNSGYAVNGCGAAPSAVSDFSHNVITGAQYGVFLPSGYTATANKFFAMDATAVGTCP